jgi:selenocysteine lyase/cysteine desulfurase
MSNNTIEANENFPKPPSVDSLLQEYYQYEDSLLDSSTRHRIISFQEPNPHRSCVSYLNHAAMGDPYHSTLELRQYLTELCYRQPMVYHRSLIPSLVERAKRRACDYLQLSENVRDGFSFVSVTGALFSVLKSIHFQPGDIIVTSDMLYHSLVDTLLYLSHKHGLIWIPIETPAGAKLDDIYHEFEQCLKNQNQTSGSSNNKVKLVIVDHISSKPSVLFPVQRICELCRSLRIPTLIDGAHVPGSVPSQHVQIEQIRPTFYAVTFHKWCNTPRGGASGGLWVNRSDVRAYYEDFIDVSSLVVHGGWVDKESSAEGGNIELYLDHTSKPSCFTDGLTQGIYDESTREYENILVLPHSLDLVLKFETEFQEHVTNLRYSSMELLKTAWNLSDIMAMLWYGDAQTVFGLSMLSIPLPTERLLEAVTFSDHASSLLPIAKKLKLLKKHIVPSLWQDYAIEVPVFVWTGTTPSLLGVRLSFGRHVKLADIARLAEAILKIIERGTAL